MTDGHDGNPQAVGRALVTGALWTYLQGWFGAVLQFGTGVVMARLLDPSDFGVFAAASAYTVLLSAQVRFGLPQSIVQARDVGKSTLHDVFWTMQAFALLAVLIVGVLALTLKEHYADPRFPWVMLALSATLFFMPLSVTAGSWLRRELRYRELAQISVILSLTGTSIGITVAAFGAGVWTFVITAWVGGLLGGILMARRARWLPGLPRIRIRRVRPLLSYGWRIHANDSIVLAGQRVQDMILGSLAGSHALGIYNRAMQSSRMPVTELLGRLYQVIFSALARLQDDTRATARMQANILCALTSAIFPILLALWFAAEPFIVGLYGDRWIEAVRPMRWMLIGSFATVLSVSLGALSDAQGLAGREIPIQILGLLLAVAAVIIGWRWGLTGIAIAMALRAWVIGLVMVAFIHVARLGLPAGAILHAVTPPLIAIAVATGSGFAILQWTTNTQGRWPDLLAAAAALITYAITWHMAFRIWRRHSPLQAVGHLLAEIIQRVLPHRAIPKSLGNNTSANRTASP